MIKKFVSIYIATLLSCSAFTQSYDNNWVFGDSAGLNFSGGEPSFFYTGINSHESCASISDSNGNLLFYTNGEKIWNRNNAVMPNGDSIHIGLLVPGFYPSSITQGVLILPIPESDSEYYLFQIQGDSENQGIEYSIVDMELDGGLGDVMHKNLDLNTDTICEKMQAVKHANGRDWWLLTCKSANDSTISFIKYLITPNAIIGPYLQSFTDLTNLGTNSSFSAGQMKFSRNGALLAFTRSYYIEIWDFDRCTGELSSQQTIHNNVGSYGCEFSSDSRRLFITKTSTTSYNGWLYQYCLDCALPIEETEEIIYECEYDYYSLGSLQIGPDDKIYASIAHLNYKDHVYSVVNNNICVINNPNEGGLACDFDTLVISLEDTRVTFGLPNMPNYKLGALEGSPCDTLLSITNSNSINIGIQIYPNPTSETIKIVLSQAVKIISIKTFNYLGEEIEISFDENLNALVKNIANGFYITEILTEKGKLSLSWEKL